jgi:exonuclease III
MSRNPNTRELAMQIKAAKYGDRVDYILVHQDIKTKVEQYSLDNIKVFRFDF